jgi:hypothetical protein
MIEKERGWGKGNIIQLQNDLINLQSSIKYLKGRGQRTNDVRMYLSSYLFLDFRPVVHLFRFPLSYFHLTATSHFHLSNRIRSSTFAPA